MFRGSCLLQPASRYLSQDKRTICYILVGITSMNIQQSSGPQLANSTHPLSAEQTSISYIHALDQCLKPAHCPLFTELFCTLYSLMYTEQCTLNAQHCTVICKFKMANFLLHTVCYSMHTQHFKLHTQHQHIALIQFLFIFQSVRLFQHFSPVWRNVSLLQNTQLGFNLLLILIAVAFQLNLSR